MHGGSCRRWRGKQDILRIQAELPFPVGSRLVHVFPVHGPFHWHSFPKPLVKERTVAQGLRGHRSPDLLCALFYQPNSSRVPPYQSTTPIHKNINTNIKLFSRNQVKRPPSTYKYTVFFTFGFQKAVWNRLLHFSIEIILKMMVTFFWLPLKSLFKP